MPRSFSLALTFIVTSLLFQGVGRQQGLAAVLFWAVSYGVYYVGIRTIANSKELPIERLFTVQLLLSAIATLLYYFVGSSKVLTTESLLVIEFTICLFGIVALLKQKPRASIEYYCFALIPIVFVDLARTG